VARANGAILHCRLGADPFIPPLLAGRIDRMYTREIMRHLTAGAIAAALLVGCGGDSSTGSDNNGGNVNGTIVQATPDFVFTPASVTIPVGQTVTWQFGSVGHTVTFDAVAGAPANIGDVNDPNVNTSISRTFSAAGTYTYHCSIHPTMTGVVTVGSSGTSTDTTTHTDTTTVPYNPYGSLRTHN
jgi:plastocyanin